MSANDNIAEKEHDRGEDDDQALRSLLARVPLTTEWPAYMKLCRKRRKITHAAPGEMRRIAILGGATTDFIEAPLQLELESLGIGSVIHRSDFNTYVHEMLDPDSKTVAFQPDISIILPTPFNISEWPSPGDTAARVDELVDRVCGHYLGLCEALLAKSKCEIILGNFHMLPTRATGNLGCRLPWDRNTFIRQINAALGRRAPDNVHVFDQDTLSCRYGITNWFDPRLWYHAKQPVSFECMVPFVRSLSAVIGAIYGKTAKCVVLDLDNTLWGGVVGDDGVEGLKIGEGDAEGEAFKAFQEYLLQLKNRGRLLAVCSKNDPENARAPFERHPDMVMKLTDIASFKAGWEPKPQVLEEIARELNIGLDSLVFVDDNPVERDLVRRTLPQVRVVELSTDPADYPNLIEQSGWLEVARLTEEDRTRADQYRQIKERHALQATQIDYDGFLASLEQKAVVRSFGPQDLDRVTQLVNKTNQFNLTTRRMTRSEVEDLLGRPDTVTACVRLADRFGDSGLISALICHRDDGALHVDTWIMSCRVFNRGVEHLLANHLFEKAKAMDVEQVRGVYIKTPKNGIVERHYAELGFDCDGSDEDGTTDWSLHVKRFTPIPVHISIVEDQE